MPSQGGLAAHAAPAALALTPTSAPTCHLPPATCRLRQVHYEGDWADDQPHGQGAMFFPNGDVYRGELVGGAAHGSGVYQATDGAVYEGEFCMGKKHGRGLFRWPDGSCYDG